MQDIREKMKEFDNMLLKQLSCYDFKKKKKHMFIRKQEDCLQHISVLETKVRGESRVYISICVGFTYEKIDRVISFIQNEEYDNRWATANINITSLMNAKTPYGFYLDESTELEPIIKDILFAIESYSLGFLESCNTLDKYEKMLLDRNENVRKSTYTLKRPEWNLLALAIVLGHKTIEEIFEEYEDDFKKNIALLKIAKEKIIEFRAIKEETGCWDEI